MRDRKKRNTIIGVLCCLLVFMGIGYGLLSQKLFIKGIGYSEGTWDIYISDMQLKTKSETAEEVSKSYDKLSANFEVDLYMPGDYVEYEITVTNAGNIKAALKEIITESSNSNEDIELSHSIEQGSILNGGESLTFNLKIEFNKNATEIPNMEEPIKYKIDMIYLQYNGNTLYDPTNKTTDNACFAINDNGEITDYDFDCGTEVIVPEEIDSIKVKSVPANLFYPTDVYEYSYVDMNSVENTYYVVKNEENHKMLMSELGGSEESLAQQNIYVYFDYEFEQEKVEVKVLEFEGGYIQTTEGFSYTDDESQADLIIYYDNITGYNYLIAKDQETLDSFYQYYAFGGMTKDDFKEYCDTEASNNGQTCDEFLSEATGISGMTFEEFCEYSVTEVKNEFETSYNVKIKGDATIPPLTEEKNLSDVATIEAFLKLTSQGMKDVDSILTKIDLSQVIYLENVNFKNIESLIEVKLPDTLKTISDYAFYGTSITEIDLPSSLESIGYRAFEALTLDKLFIPKSVKEIGQYAFNKTGITSLTFEKGSQLLEISSGTFAYNNLTSIELPENVVKIGGGSFISNKINGKLKLPSKVETVGGSAFEDNQITSIDLSNVPNLTSLYGFKNNKITSLDLSNVPNLTSLGGFENNQIASLDLKNLTKLTSLSGFSNNQLTSLDLSNNKFLKSIYSGAFSDNNIAGLVYIPNSVTTIGSSAFARNKITTVNIPTSLQTIDYYVFENNEISKITIPKNITKIEYRAFAYNKITNLTFESDSSLKTISSYVFGDNQLTNVGLDKLPSTLTSLATNAFSDNANLTQITLTSPTDIDGWPDGGTVNGITVTYER